MSSNVNQAVLDMFNQTQEALDSVQSSNILPAPLGESGYDRVPVFVTGITAEPAQTMKVYNASSRQTEEINIQNINFQFEYAIDPDFLLNHPSLEPTFKGAPFAMPVDFQSFESTVGPMGVTNERGPWNPALDKGRTGIRNFKSAASSMLGVPQSELDTGALQEMLDLLEDPNAQIRVTLRFAKDGRYTREYMAAPETAVDSLEG